MNAITSVGPEELADLESGALLVDVREPGEFAGKRLAGSINVPLSRLDAAAGSWVKVKPVVILCHGGVRSHDAAMRLAALGFSDIRVVEGGLSGFRRGALTGGKGSVWPMERQVRLAAGALVLAGVAVGALVHPLGYALSAAVGAGLAFSAVTDSCGLARVLALMPWNRAA